MSPKPLPPSGTDLETAGPPSEPSTTPAVKKKPYWYRDKNTKAYEQAMKIFAMRAAGIEDKQIAEAMNLNTQSVYNLCFIAGKNGWVSDQLARAKDVVEFQIMPKVLRELEAGLDDTHRNEKTGMQVKTLVAMRVAESTVFKSFDQPIGTANGNIIAIKIDMAPGTTTTMREGTGGGVGAYIDAETTDVGNSGLQPRSPEV